MVVIPELIYQLILIKCKLEVYNAHELWDDSSTLQPPVKQSQLLWCEGGMQVWVVARCQKGFVVEVCDCASLIGLTTGSNAQVLMHPELCDRHLSLSKMKMLCGVCIPRSSRSILKGIGNGGFLIARLVGVAWGLINIDAENYETPTATTIGLSPALKMIIKPSQKIGMNFRVCSVIPYILLLGLGS